MTELEITEIPPLQPHEQSLLAVHSLLNVFNVLRGELTLIGISLADQDDLFTHSLATCDSWIANLGSPESSLADARQVDDCADLVFAEINAAMATRPDLSTEPEIVDSLANIQSVFQILRVRTRELLARAHAPDRWDMFSIEGLRQGFLQVFSAIEKNSHGRYRIIYNAALKEPNDYYFDFKLESNRGDNLLMPAVFQDVMRDLIANARKYTAPGGHITAALHEDPTLLRFVVEDTGRGIPPDEIEKVVHFGQRASNVNTVRTMGGGFGLTKAFLVAKQFGGRFWIASELGVGTRVRIHLPRPM